MDKIQTVFIPTAGYLISGDSWNGIEMSLRDGPEGAELPVDLTGAQVCVDLYVSGGSPDRVLKSLKTGGAGITITNGPAGEFMIDPITRFDLPDGVIAGQLEVTTAGNTRKTYCEFIFTVGKNTTNRNEQQP